MDEKIFVSSQTAATGLKIIPMRVSRWLSALGLSSPTGGNGNPYKLSRETCVVLALINRLSKIKAAGFNNLAILALVQMILGGKDEEELRQAQLAVLSGLHRRVALTGASNLVDRHAGDEMPPWENEDSVRAWAFDGTLSLVALKPLFEAADSLFAQEAAKKPTNRPWEAMGISRQWYYKKYGSPNKKGLPTVVVGKMK